jgi:hypothetical protein
LRVSSVDNADSGLYTVGFETLFEGGKATKSCIVELEILAHKLTNFSSSYDRKESVRFVDSKAEGIIEFDKDMIESQIFKLVVLNCLESWSGTLPSIQGEAEGEKFTIKVDLGVA